MELLLVYIFVFPGQIRYCGISVSVVGRRTYFLPGLIYFIDCHMHVETAGPPCVAVVAKHAFVDLARGHMESKEQGKLSTLTPNKRSRPDMYYRYNNPHAPLSG